MAWRFVDRQGREGRIGEGLSVDYSGEGEIEELVERIAREVESDTDRVGDPTQQVAIELYITGAVRMVEREDETAPDDETGNVESRSTTNRSAHADGERSG